MRECGEKTDWKDAKDGGKAAVYQTMMKCRLPDNTDTAEAEPRHSRLSGRGYLM